MLDLGSAGYDNMPIIEAFPQNILLKFFLDTTSVLMYFTYVTIIIIVVDSKGRKNMKYIKAFVSKVF